MYIAIKVRDFDYWLWFEESNVKEDSGIFVGKKGWGKGGHYTEIEIPISEIIGKMRSEVLQYR